VNQRWQARPLSGIAATDIAVWSARPSRFFHLLETAMAQFVFRSILISLLLTIKPTGHSKTAIRFFGSLSMLVPPTTVSQSRAIRLKLFGNMDIFYPFIFKTT
jgi:hypothetical protein